MADPEKYEELFYDLHTGVVGDNERPHKPVMLLALIDLVGSGEIAENLVPFSPGLRDRFSRYFDIVREGNDSDTPWNPYFYLRSEPFWELLPASGDASSIAALGSPPSPGKIPGIIAGARLDGDLWQVLSDPVGRERLRDVLVSRYFPQHRDRVFAIAGVEQPGLQGPDPSSPRRSAGFRKVVVDVYEHQCAACGLRIHLPGGGSVVEAAHIIPFAESHNDHPRNGLALCRNHHWAMDAFLIAPGPDLNWHASPRLDDRQPGQRELIELSGRSVILPKEEAYNPLEEALLWRRSHLAC